MKPRTLIQLLAALVVCCFVFVVVECSNSNRGLTKVEASNEKVRLLEDFKLNDISEISITSLGERVKIVRGKEFWFVANRENYPADTNKVISLIKSVWGANISSPVPLQENQYKRVQLGDPAEEGIQEKDAATIVSFTNGEEDLGTLWIGKGHGVSTGQSDPYSGGLTTTDGGRYVRRSGSQVVYITIEEMLRDASPKPADWLNTDFLEISTVKSIQRTTGNLSEDWKLSREKLSDEFALEGGVKEGEELDDGKMGVMKTAFSSTQFVDVLVGDEAKVPEGNQFIITTFGGLTYQIQLGEKDEDSGHLPMALTVTGSFAESRTPVDGESEEEKNKADEAFKASLAAKKAKLAKEKAFENRVFKIRSHVVDQLNKTRSELYKEEGSDQGPPPGMPMQGMPFGGSGPKLGG